MDKKKKIIGGGWEVLDRFGMKPGTDLGWSQ